MMKINWMICSLLLFLVCFPAESQTLNTGPWRFEVKTTHALIPFIINLNYKNNKLTGELQNGKETIPLTDITETKETISIPLQTYEMTLELKKISEVLLRGYLIRHNKNPKVSYPVQASHGQNVRFPQEKVAPTIDLNGKWQVTIVDDEGNSSPGVILFEQKAEKLTGSIITPTGDHRYFEGFVSGATFEAASFDGVYNYLFRGEVKDKQLKASILSNSSTKVEGSANANATLPDAYKQTELSSLEFSFPDLAGKQVSLNDKKFKNKPVIVQFFGSWCPNCMDEMNFLIPWYNKNKKRGIEVVALAFERSVDPAEAKKQLHKVSKKKKIPYPLLVAGHTAEDKPKDKITGLKNFISFPTTVFLNKKHEVVKVHAGFTGPSTGEFFEKWKVEFDQTVTDLLK
ncbi:MAG TPA: TlpA disulfide reductase family protein [Bacteriovoracaceae bacterium]|nr:TlpA disulfide reductase family protein [Bacteriovoracaceae bacterium]